MRAVMLVLVWSAVAAARVCPVATTTTCTDPEPTTSTSTSTSTTTSTSTSSTSSSTSTSTSTSVTTTSSAGTTSTSTSTSAAPTTSTSSSTTTTTSGGTTTTAGFVQDDFNRAGPAIGANWTETSFSACVIRSSNQLSADPNTTGECAAEYTAASPGSTNTYACGKLVLTGSNQASAGACLGTNTDFNSAACCYAFDTGWSLFNYGGTGSDSGSDTFANGDFIGIQRTSATAFRCFKSTNGTSWTGLGSGTTSLTSVDDPGKWGVDLFINNLSNMSNLDAWEGGLGTLPTGHTCGG